MVSFVRLSSLTLAVAFLLTVARPVLAHPLGNFSINHYAGIEVGADTVAIRYVIDMAEIPTFQEIRENEVVPDDADPSALRYLATKVEELKRGLVLQVNGRPAELAVAGTQITFPPGVGGLPTMKLGARLRAAVPPGPPGTPVQVFYRDTNFEGRAGWKEIVVKAREGTALLSSSAPATDRSQQLAAYPLDMLNSPPQDLEARSTFAVQSPPPFLASTQPPPQGPGGPAMREGRDAPKDLPPAREGVREPASTNAAGIGQPPAPDRDVRPPEGAPPVPKPSTGLQARGASGYDLDFAQLISLKELSPGIVLFALLLAFALGAFHALEPGHGKTVVAAYLVGSRGTARHALLLGLIVTASHTAGVYLLGVITLGASAYIVPERLYPWLGLLSGVAIVGLGLTMLARSWRGARGGRPAAQEQGAGPAHAHDHHDHGHAHGGLWHTHGAGGHHDGGDSHTHPEASGPSVSARELLVLGITGGIIPCPAALVVLLSAIALGRVGFGLLLIVGFSAGLAIVLMGIGLLTVSTRRLMSRVSGTGPLLRWLPVFSSAAMIALGLGLATQALVSGGL
jgi:ABC-type nickel/cobalt efflux system permease component RcnA